MSLSSEEVSKGIIDAYRIIINDRYQLSYLQENYNIPIELDEVQITALRVFFLDYIYPPYEQRMALNDAFNSLDDHIRQPSHIMKILMDSSSLLFRYGLKLPAILKAGIKALRSFRTASKFENQLIAAAISQDLKPPYSSDQVNQLITTLPMSDIEQFMNQGEDLFSIIYDTKLVKSIIKILDSLISKMKKRSSVYSVEEIEGFEIGQQIITKGYDLFQNLNPRYQSILLDKIVEIERTELERIYGQSF